MKHLSSLKLRGLAGCEIIGQQSSILNPQSSIQMAPNIPGNFLFHIVNKYWQSTKFLS